MPDNQRHVHAGENHAAGKHYKAVDAICNPKPLQKNLPLMIGGHGELG